MADEGLVQDVVEGLAVGGGAIFLAGQRAAGGGRQGSHETSLPAIVALSKIHFLIKEKGHLPQPATALPLTLDRASEIPLAVQLADALRESASSGHLRGGDRLPSTRALADRLGVSR